MLSPADNSSASDSRSSVTLMLISSPFLIFISSVSSVENGARGIRTQSETNIVAVQNSTLISSVRSHRESEGLFSASSAESRSIFITEIRLSSENATFSTSFMKSSRLSNLVLSSSFALPTRPSFSASSDNATLSSPGRLN